MKTVYVKRLSLLAATFSVVLMSGTAFAQGANPAMSMPQTSGAKAASTAVLPATPEGKLANPIPSAVIGVPAQPLSSEQMIVSGQHINGQVETAIQQANARLANVNIGSGDMKVAPLPDTTLQQDINAEAKIHEMNLKMQEVIMASKLWGSAYDGKREIAADKDAAQKAAAQRNSMPGINGMGPQESKEEAQRREAEQEKEDAIAAEEASQKKQAERKKLLGEQMQLQKRNMGNIPPIVSSIYGPVIAPRATILIPYVGTQNVKKGDSFILIDGTRMSITDITPDGVYASHAGAKSQILGFGSSVPTQSDAIRSLHRVVDAIQGEDNNDSGTSTSMPNQRQNRGNTMPPQGNTMQMRPQMSAPVPPGFVNPPGPNDDDN